MLCISALVRDNDYDQNRLRLGSGDCVCQSVILAESSTVKIHTHDTGAARGRDFGKFSKNSRAVLEQVLNGEIGFSFARGARSTRPSELRKFVYVGCFGVRPVKNLRENLQVVGVIIRS